MEDYKNGEVWIVGGKEYELFLTEDEKHYEFIDEQGDEHLIFEQHFDKYFRIEK